MNDTKESLIRPLVFPFLLMLAFYLALDAVSGLGASLVASLPVLAPFKPFVIAMFLMFGIKIVIGLLFIRRMGDGMRNHGFTLKSPDLSIRPAIILGAAMAAVYFAKGLPSMLTHPEMHASAPLKIDTMIFDGLYTMVNAFIFCAVIQAFISRRSDGHVRILRWDIPLAGIAVSLIAFLYPVTQCIIVFLRDGSSLGIQGSFLSEAIQVAYSYLSSALLSGALALVFTYLYDRSRSLAAPVIAGLAVGVINGVLYYMAISGNFLNPMR
jgi:hypothetical protein